MMKHSVQFLIVLTVLMSSLFASAQAIHKWVDKDGVVHFSQHAPVNVETEQVVIPTVGKATKRSKDDQPAENNTEDATPDARQVILEDAEPTFRKDAATCERARALLNSLDTGRRLRIRDPETGEYSFPSEQDLSDQRRQAAEQVSQHC